MRSSQVLPEEVVAEQSSLESEGFKYTQQGWEVWGRVAAAWRARVRGVEGQVLQGFVGNSSSLHFIPNSIEKSLQGFKQ